MLQTNKERIYDDNPVYYVYYLVNPETKNPFYVGKGKGNRCKQHLTDKMEYSRNKRLTGHIKKLRERGIEPVIIKFKENLVEKDAYDLEEKKILEYGRIGFEKNGILMNLLIEARPPLLRGKDNGFYNRTHTEETKKIIGEKNKGRIRSEETKEKIRQTHLGIPKSEEHRNKIKIKAIGRSHSKETREKLRKHNLQEDVLKKNIESKQKEWIVIFPNGHEEEIINLSDFCKEYGLSRSKMYEVAAGRASHHKNYKCKKKNS
jgi:hypothetical protein